MVVGRVSRGASFSFGIVFFLTMVVRAAEVGDFSSNWPAATQRAWVGPAYWANRLQDWQIRDGRLECVEASPRKPMRTVQLLTRTLSENKGTLAMRVRTGPTKAGGKPIEDTWAGFLIGAGGAEVDCRISALVHHWPAEDGGLLAVVNGRGKVVFRDNTKGESKQVNKLFPSNTWPEIKATSSEGKGFGDKIIDDIELRLDVEPSGNQYKLVLAAHDHKTGKLISRATLDGVDPKHVSGNVALVSHLSGHKGGKGYWFRDWTVSGSKVEAHEERAYGPVLCAQHTLSGGVLKMTAQMPPLGKQDTREVRLQIRAGKDEPWKTVAEATLVDHSCTFPFRVENWDASRDVHYRIVYELRTGADSTRPCYWEGTVRAEPLDRDTLVVAAFTGHRVFTGGKLRWNGKAIWFPHNDLVRAVAYHKPDLLFFSGDQIYEGDLTGVQRKPLDKAILDYLDKWYRWCWAFKDLARDIPCICIPDDHDVYHGNIWGAGGRKALRADDGGYVMDPVFVNMVQHTQTSHLPDPVDPRPVDQGIEVYFTSMDYGGVSFAVLEDRKFKSSPTVMIPEGKVVNGFFQNPDFDVVSKADVPGAVLLGRRQLAFLKSWGADWAAGVEMKVVLSQTIFANVATVPKRFKTDAGMPGIPPVPPGVIPDGYKLAVDADSNGWPQTGRNKALRELRRAFAFHIAGDQHLGSIVQHGIDEPNDAGYSFCVPAIGNIWPRRWYPPTPGHSRKRGSPLYTGQFKDGFGNPITVHAVSNPVISGHEPATLHDRAPGYGIVRLNKRKRTITMECWPRYAYPADPDARQYPGWPMTIRQEDNYGRKAAAYLPTIRVQGMTDPVLQVIDEADGQVVYTLRIRGTRYRPKVFKAGSYTIRVGEPGTERVKVLKRIRAKKDNAETVEVALPSRTST